MILPCDPSRAFAKAFRSTLFASYLLLVVLSTAFVTVFSFFYTRNAMTRLAMTTIGDVSSRLVDALDAELLRMNSVSVAIASSDLVRQLVREREALPRRRGLGGPARGLPERRRDRRRHAEHRRALQAGTRR